MPTPKNAPYKLLQRECERKCRHRSVLYAQGPKHARGNHPAQRKWSASRGVYYVPFTA